MEIGFEFEVVHVDGDLLKVRASAWNGSFGGATHVYVAIRQLEETADEISGFPTDPLDSREITLGAFGPEWAGGGLSMRFYCADASGHTFVQSKIESPTLSGKPVQDVNLLLPIEVAAVDSFVDELRRVGTNRSGTAHLAGVSDR